MDEVVKAYLEPPEEEDLSKTYIFSEESEEGDFIAEATNFITMHCKLHLEEVSPPNALGNDAVTGVVGSPLEVYILPKKYKKRNVKEMLSLIRVASKFGIKISVMHSIGKSRWERFDLF